MTKKFKYRGGTLRFPVFFPDATRAIIKSLDSTDIESTKTQGILVNTFHLWKDMDKSILKKVGGIGNFMNFKGAIISDSGGFQVGSLIKKNPELGYVNNYGAHFKIDGKRHLTLTPEESIRFQMELGSDMVVALDDFDAPGATEEENRITVERTIDWAKRSKNEFEKICKEKNLSKAKRPYILGVVQGGRHENLRKYCIDELVKIGFDGLGYGGEEKIKGNVNYNLSKFLADNTPNDYLLYALGVGKPEDIVAMVKLGYDIFDCVLPTRDARHKRLYVYNAKSIDKIDLTKKDFYSFVTPDKKVYLNDENPISTACDCLTCKRYSRAYLAHLFKIGDFTAGRLATIHNLRFYSILMEKLRG